MIHSYRGEQDEQSRREVESQWPHHGDLMKFLGQHGYDFEREAALKVFVINEIYTVDELDLGDWSHRIKFKEVPGWWNGVMFSRLLKITTPPETPEVTNKLFEPLDPHEWLPMAVQMEKEGKEASGLACGDYCIRGSDLIAKLAKRINEMCLAHNEGLKNEKS